MCGIAGLVGVPEGTEVVRAMCETIAHRGPDGGGVASHARATIGMKRLAIVDVEHGVQPMANEDESIVVVHNGEIYNAPALRRELSEQGIHFRTRSDTEVVLRLYEHDRERFESRMNGMWAIAIHDRRRNKLFLSRDRFGIKPLFLARGDRAIAFASELRAFAPLRRDARFAKTFALDAGSAHAMLSWSYVPSTETIFESVKRVAPAAHVEIDLETFEAREKTYWTLTPSSEAALVRSIDEACELVDPLLARSVKEHLESDVPVACFLSGGIDSSLIVSHTAALSPKKLRAFSIGFEDARFDESPHARAAGAMCGVDVDVTILDEAKMRSHLANALVAYDEPFGDSSSLATHLLSSVVGASYKVALGGDGGDEVFAGYKKHRILPLRNAFARAPRVRDALGDVLLRIPLRTDRSRGWTELLRTARRASRGLSGDDATSYVALTQVGSLAKTAPLVREPADHERFEAPLRHAFESFSGTALQRTLAGDLANPLPNDMLTKVDRASMACHLEARVPFLDHRIAEAGVGLPPAYSLGKKGKAVLRALHEKKFGRELANRKKQGFGVPVERWLRTSLDAACERLFSREALDRHGLLSSEELSDGRHRAWAEKDPQILWHAFALAAWCEVSFGDGPEGLHEMLNVHE